MPDINQSNALVAQYLIQNTIWWIEYAHIDGIRMDTHMYPDKYFMRDWMQAVTHEYPDFYVVGEILMYSMPFVGYWQKDAQNKDGVRVGESVLRFYTQFADPAKETYSWNKTFQNDKNAFISGKLAFYFGYASEYKDIQQKNPNLRFDIIFNFIMCVSG